MTDVPPRRRRRVFVTAGLTASAAVLAMAVQSTTVPDEDQVAPGGSSYGDPLPADPDSDE